MTLLCYGRQSAVGPHRRAVFLLFLNFHDPHIDWDLEFGSVPWSGASNPCGVSLNSQICI